MQQIIHIFQKDARRSWPYIALVLALTAMSAILTPKWVPSMGPDTEQMKRLVEILHFVLPLAWWFTIAHVVQGDGLVGTTQFWITRPYSWKTILAAKLLFCVAFLLLPHLVSDWIVLSVDGFSPRAMIPALLWRQCSMFGVRMLPAFILAAVTRGMRQFVLACFLLVVAFFLSDQVWELYPSDPTVSALQGVVHAYARTWVKEWRETIFYAGGLIALLLWQFSRRQTGVARAVVLAIVAWLLVDGTAWPPRLIAWAPQQQPVDYPEVAVVFAPQRDKANVGVRDNVLQVDIPIELTGRNRDLLDAEMASVSVEPAHGAAWSSAWNYYVDFRHQSGADWMEFRIDPQDFQRLNAGPVTVRAVFGVVVYEPQSTTRIAASGGWTDIPGFGKITIPPNYEPREPGLWILWWRVPFREPEQKFVFTMHDPDSGVVLHGDHSFSYPPPAQIATMSPEVFFGAFPDDHRSSKQLETPISPNAWCDFTLERPVALIRRDLEIPNIRLEDYAVK